MKRIVVKLEQGLTRKQEIKQIRKQLGKRGLPYDRNQALGEGYYLKKFDVFIELKRQKDGR